MMMFISVGTNYNYYFTLLLSFSLHLRTKLESGRQFILSFPCPTTIVSENIRASLTRWSFISSWSRRVDSDWYKGGRTSALHKSADRSPKVRVSTEQRAVNCFEDEVSSRIRKDEPRAWWFRMIPFTPFPLVYLSISMNGRWSVLVMQSYIESALVAQKHIEKLVAKICLGMLLKIFWHFHSQR